MLFTSLAAVNSNGDPGGEVSSAAITNNLPTTAKERERVMRIAQRTGQKAGKVVISMHP